MKIYLSELDKQRFGIVTAKLNIELDEDLNAALAWSEERSVKLLISRVATDQIKRVQSMELAGFYLTDTLVYFMNKKINHPTINLPDGYWWRLANSDDAQSVEYLATQTFVGYSGHYHADQNLAVTDCDLVYSSWAATSCKDNSMADGVILVFNETELAGFATLRKVEEYMCEGVLFGVGPKHQGKGLYQSLMSLALKWTHESFCSQMIVSTQVTNLAVQKVWCRMGFEPYKSFYTFHKWFSK